MYLKYVNWIFKCSNICEITCPWRDMMLLVKQMELLCIIKNIWNTKYNNILPKGFSKPQKRLFVKRYHWFLSSFLNFYSLKFCKNQLNVFYFDALISLAFHYLKNKKNENRTGKMTMKALSLCMKIWLLCDTSSKFHNERGDIITNFTEMIRITSECY